MKTTYSQIGFSQRGFSLLEILLVMTFIAVIAGFVTSSMTKSLKQTKIRSVSKDLVSAMRYTRGQAIVKHEQKVITFNVREKTYQAPRKKIVHIPEDMEINVYTADLDVQDESTGSIRFFSDGSSTGGWVKLTYGEKMWKISVNWLTGEITMLEGT
ncbi:MAG TPA: prepilin-type N-terminal cleavage/methylation domain-containing protein [Gammaproteobacteria bacterium]|nr:prepilin-type N-terminal cleavage/methylation domain-containing protein [Xanthomonadales bacterium]MCB1594496.1 prepilin-type N-terminal cleavage/methylation domain-containing protein [Xanthomonadales bacterium]HPI95720.1 prepilin-type N-terminal cleavage/methylation domain-containing protein [Gammaproteobacteria bacterium]HPQ87603.1 prepilin-type N-terminal cleavage/methylation domain-containing protein [Gammaproteobacteria bacterium]